MRLGLGMDIVVRTRTLTIQGHVVRHALALDVVEVGDEQARQRRESRQLAERGWRGHAGSGRWVMGSLEERGGFGKVEMTRNRSLRCCCCTASAARHTGPTHNRRGAVEVVHSPCPLHHTTGTPSLSCFPLPL
jgi:hypothetical protein